MIWECPFCGEEVEIVHESLESCLQFHRHLSNRHGFFTGTKLKPNGACICGKEWGGHFMKNGLWSQHLLSHAEQTNKAIVLWIMGNSG